MGLIGQDCANHPTWGLPAAAVGGGADGLKGSGAIEQRRVQ